MSITPPDSALGRSLEAWASGHYPCRADVRELLDEGYDVGALEARHFIPRISDSSTRHVSRRLTLPVRTHTQER